MDNYKIGDEVELLEDFYTRSGAEIIFKKGTIAKVIELQLYDEIHIEVNGDNRWCSPDILKLVDKKDPALISGADAFTYLIGGSNDVQTKLNDTEKWRDVPTGMSWAAFANPDRKFRLKPQTIKLELEIPAPSKAKIGGRDDTSFVLNIGRHQYCYNNEEDYTKARDALEAVFDAAVRGTNS
ncbi:hypothetical protein MWMV1_MWMV1_01988 [Acinetobacter baumannii]|uniref:hypothetical protein n=1 Tax=Acinetobacter baumannii TaxID=470 RepID=UPI0021F04AFB|nr:hypothetical protein MWMV6_MWMV6_01988 [Acinetobacter baumannii]CAI4176326.1 hypothetical protein MWMV1_MWMV1_01988 [Acinetobacter baumannii]